MAQKSWPWSTVAALGDGAVTLSEAISREFLAAWFHVHDVATEGVSKGVGGELAVTGAASPLAVASGSGICYGLYINDAATTTPAITTPAVGTTGGRVVLQTNWGGTGGAGLEARTRIAVKKSADGNAAIPALTQVFGTTWEISLATFTITTGGVITPTDARVFRKSTMVTDTAELAALAVTTAKIALLNITTALINDLAVTTGKLADLAVTSGKLAALSVIAGKIADGAVDTAARLAANVVTTAKILDANVTTAKLALLSVTTAIINDLAVTTAKIAANAVTTAKLALNSVDDTIAGDRVPQFYRRQGGDATDWMVVGATSRTPTAVRIQAGMIQWTGASSPNGTKLVTFPVAFSARPIVIVTPNTAGITFSVTAPTSSASDFTITWEDLLGTGHTAVDFSWVAFGAE